MAEHGPLQYSSPWFLASCVKVTHVFLTPTDRWFSCSVCSLPFTEEGIRNVYRHVLAFICKSRLSRLQSSRESNKQPPGICHHAGSQVRGPGPSGLSLPSLTSPPPPAGAPGGLSAPRRCPGGGSRKPAAVLSRRRGTSWTRVKVQTRWESSSKETAPCLLWFWGCRYFRAFSL